MAHPRADGAQGRRAAGGDRGIHAGPPDALDDEDRLRLRRRAQPPKTVGEETYRRALARWRAVGVVELTALIGYYTMVAMTLNCHDIPCPTAFRHRCRQRRSKPAWRSPGGEDHADLVMPSIALALTMMTQAAPADDKRTRELCAAADGQIDVITEEPTADPLLSHGRIPRTTTRSPRHGGEGCRVLRPQPRGIGASMGRCGHHAPTLGT